MGDKSPKSKLRDKNQKTAAKAKIKAEQAKRRDGFNWDANKPAKK
jgi:hypothetical protein